ncbi:MAG: polysaccharide deacetylase [Hyphomicrobiales bacterium]|nr:polysaccharide deacetylase [Hyphomicrobiales bacterium]
MFPRQDLYQFAMSSLGRIADLLHMRGQAIFCLHSVTDERTKVLPHGRMSVTAHFLAELITSLKECGIACVSLGEAIERLQRRDQAPFVSFTFDDGYRDNYEVAFPVFKRHGVPFAIFLATGLLDRTSPMWWHLLEHVVQSNQHVDFGGVRYPSHDPVTKGRTYDTLDARFRALPTEDKAAASTELWKSNPSGLMHEHVSEFALDWRMVREMSESGLVTFGGHTVSHPVLARVPGNDLKDEISQCHARILEETRVAPRFFAYPFGQPDEVGDDAPRVVMDSGYDFGFTTCSRPIAPCDLETPAELPRIMLVKKSQSAVIARAYISGLPFRLKRSMRLLRGSKGNP